MTKVVILGVFAFVMSAHLKSQNFDLAPYGVGGPVLSDETEITSVSQTDDYLVLCGTWEYGVTADGAEIPNSGNLLFWDGADWEVSEAQALEATTCYAKFIGSEYIGTASGLKKRSGENWVNVFGSVRPADNIYTTDTYMIYIERNPDESWGYVSDVYITYDGTQSTLVTSFGNFTESICEYKGIVYMATIRFGGFTESYQNIRAIDPVLMSEIAFPLPEWDYYWFWMSAANEWNGKLIVNAMVLSPFFENAVITFDGADWEVLFDSSIMTPYIIGDDLYMSGSRAVFGASLSKVSLDGVTTTPIYWNGEEWSADYFFFFKGNYYMAMKNSSSGIYSPPDYTEHIYSNLVKFQAPLGVGDPEVKQFAVFPNPVGGQVSVGVMSDIAINNLMGQKISFEFIDATTIDLKNIPAGNYILTGKIRGERYYARLTIVHE